MFACRLSVLALHWKREHRATKPSATHRFATSFHQLERRAFEELPASPGGHAMHRFEGGPQNLMDFMGYIQILHSSQPTRKREACQRTSAALIPASLVSTVRSETQSWAENAHSLDITFRPARRPLALTRQPKTNDSLTNHYRDRNATQARVSKARSYIFCNIAQHDHAHNSIDGKAHPAHTITSFLARLVQPK